MTREEAIEKLNEAIKFAYSEADAEVCRMAIAALRKQDATDTNVGCKWISVEERLPEDDGHVLIYSLGGGVAEGIYSKIYKKWVQYRWSIFEPEVTHWMPLPEPPKED